MKRIILILLFTTTLVFGQELNKKYYFKGAWVATVANIDWPTNKDASSGEQIAELVNIFDKLQEAGINAVFFQIRTECDALYDSKIEPWSFWLTGEQGKAPDPYYDPLEFAITEAHKRGMELHAWFNPYRAVKTIGEYKASENHVSKKHPEWLFQSEKYLMLNPGLPEVENYIVSIVTDVLNRYDVDGIHFDDYFYPYTKMKNQDSLTYVNYNRGIDNIDDWRRDNINKLMAKLYKAITVVKPYVKFGISPFGIVENKYADTEGFESYNVLYCDPLNWLENKIVDYINPQLYWDMDHKYAPFRKLLPWWNEISDERHLYVGLFSTKFMGDQFSKENNQIREQLLMSRKFENVKGEVFFSAKSIVYNYNGLSDSLKSWYKGLTLTPKMAWKDNILPNPPENLKVNYTEETAILSWNTPEAAIDGDKPHYYLIYRFKVGENIDLSDNKNIISKIPGYKNAYEIKSGNLKNQSYVFLVSSVDRLSNESQNNPSIIVNFKKAE